MPGPVTQSLHAIDDNLKKQIRNKFRMVARLGGLLVDIRENMIAF